MAMKMKRWETMVRQFNDSPKKVVKWTGKSTTWKYNRCTLKNFLWKRWRRRSVLLLVIIVAMAIRKSKSILFISTRSPIISFKMKTFYDSFVSALFLANFPSFFVTFFASKLHQMRLIVLIWKQWSLAQQKIFAFIERWKQFRLFFTLLSFRIRKVGIELRVQTKSIFIHPITCRFLIHCFHLASANDDIDDDTVQISTDNFAALNI